MVLYLCVTKDQAVCLFLLCDHFCLCKEFSQCTFTHYKDSNQSGHLHLREVLPLHKCTLHRCMIVCNCTCALLECIYMIYSYLFLNYTIIIWVPLLCKVTLNHTSMVHSVILVLLTIQIVSGTVLQLGMILFAYLVLKYHLLLECHLEPEHHLV